jgi:CheY-like chemotaxis protein
MYHQAHSLAPDVVVIDASTPGGDEYEATQRMKIHRDPPAVIVVSPHESSDYEEGILAMGADACIPMSQLEVRLEQVLDRLFPQPDSADLPSDFGLALPTLFLVDDDVTLATLVAASLRTFGYDVRSFHDPIVALRAIRQGGARPDVLVTDYQMPHMNGLDLIEHAVALLPGLRTISASGTLREELHLSGRMRPHRFVPKPYQIKELIEAIQDLWSPAISHPRVV